MGLGFSRQLSGFGPEGLLTVAITIIGLRAIAIGLPNEKLTFLGGLGLDRFDATVVVLPGLFARLLRLLDALPLPGGGLKEGKDV